MATMRELCHPAELALGQGVNDAPWHDVGGGCSSVTHIINPLPFDDFSQNMSMYSILQAASLANTSGLDVSLYIVYLQGEREFVPHHSKFVVLPELRRLSHNFVREANAKQTPVLKDSRVSLLESSSSECLAFTNADIILKPEFYLMVD